MLTRRRCGRQSEQGQRQPDGGPVLQEEEGGRGGRPSLQSRGWNHPDKSAPSQLFEEVWLEAGAAGPHCPHDLHILPGDVLQVSLAIPSPEESNHAPQEPEEEDQDEEGGQDKAAGGAGTTNRFLRSQGGFKKSLIWSKIIKLSLGVRQ